MALRTITTYLPIVDDNLSDVPLLTPEAMRPCHEHTKRKLLREVEGDDK